MADLREWDAPARIVPHLHGMGNAGCSGATVGIVRGAPLQYLRAIEAGGVTRTESIGEGVHAEFGKDGALLGVELLGPGAVRTFFSIVSMREQFQPLRKLEAKKELLERLIA